MQIHCMSQLLPAKKKTPNATKTQKNPPKKQEQQKKNSEYSKGK